MKKHWWNRRKENLEENKEEEIIDFKSYLQIKKDAEERYYDSKKKNEEEFCYEDLDWNLHMNKINNITQSFQYSLENNSASVCLKLEFKTGNDYFYSFSNYLKIYYYENISFYQNNVDLTFRDMDSLRKFHKNILF